MTERTFDDFDGFAADYRQLHSKNVQLSGADSWYFAEFKVKQLRRFEADAPMRLLDLGCGDGATERFLQQSFQHCTAVGIDVSAASLEQARSQSIPQTTFAHFDGQHIPFENESFDVVFIAAVFHHIHFDQHLALMQEVFRVLKKGGRLYFFEHNPLNPVTRYLVKTCVFDADAVLLSFSYSRKLLRKAGLETIQSSFLIFFPRKGWLSKLMGLEKQLEWLPLGGQYLLRATK